jgi:hypothetical protein
MTVGDPDTGHPLDASARYRHDVRAFVRAHHPDLGGDPAEFVAGLARLRASAPPSHPPAIAGPDRPGDPAADDPRLDAPVVLLPEPASIRLARALGRSLRRLRRRRDILLGLDLDEPDTD